MKTFTSLPDTKEQVDAMEFNNMVETVLDLCKPGTEIKHAAGLQANAFLAYAAVRMANHIKDKNFEDDKDL